MRVRLGPEEKREFLEGDGLQAVHKCLPVNAALGAEEAAFTRYSTFSAACLVGPLGLNKDWALAPALSSAAGNNTRAIS